MFAFRFKSAEKPTKSALDFKTIFRNQLEEGDNLWNATIKIKSQKI